MKRYERAISILLLFIISLSQVVTPAAYAAETGKFHVKLPIVGTQNNFPVPQTDVPQPGEASVLGTSTSLLSIGTQAIDTQLSAAKRIPVRMKQLSQRVFKTDEPVNLAVSNPDNVSFTTSVVDSNNNPVSAPVTQNDNGSTTDVQITPTNEIKPGIYHVTVTDQAGNTSQQDFSWGVLALNTDKSMYYPGETGDIAMAVLNDKGDMVCDANVELRIKNTPFGIDDVLTMKATGSAQIVVNPQCQKHDFSLQPDYEAHYTFKKSGTYTFQLTATTQNGTKSITDSVQVTNTIPFDVQRVSATRIYPPNTYPVTFNITAHQDFSGTVTETVPQDFTITPATQSANQSYSNMQTMYLNGNDPTAQLAQAVLGTGTSTLVMPFHGSYPITQGFGVQLTDPGLQAFYTHYGLAGHDGIDFGLPTGTPLYTVDDGSVVWAGPGDYGITIIIQHSWGRSYYGHLSNTSVSVGQSVTKGQQIGFSGASGEATGPHLHFGMRPNNPDMSNSYYGKIDPMAYLPLGHAALATDAIGPQISLPNTENAASNSALRQAQGLTTPTPATTSNAASAGFGVLGTATQASGSAVTTTPTPTASVSASPAPVSPTPTPVPSVYSATTIGPTNTYSSVLNKEIKINEQLTNSSQTEKVKIITWHVHLKKGEQTSLGYAFLAPKVSPQFYLLGPLRFYSDRSDSVVFQEQRQWQIASDDVGVDWYSNTTGSTWNGYNWQYRKKIDINSSLVSVASPSASLGPTVDFIDSGGDATFGADMYDVSTTSGGSTVAADSSTTETGPRSLKFTSGTAGAAAYVVKQNVVSDAGDRISAYTNIANYPTAGNNEAFLRTTTSGGLTVLSLRFTDTGILQLTNSAGTQLGSNGPVLATSTWYRIALSYTITDVTHYSANVYVNGVLVITTSCSACGTSLTNSPTAYLRIGWIVNGVGNSLALNMDDIYVDSGTDLSDPGDIHVTAKLPVQDGDTNSFTPVGSAAGTACNTAASTTHCRYVNERPLSTANYLQGPSSASFEFFTVQSAAQGDVDISNDNYVAQQSWVYMKEETTGCNATAMYNNFNATNNTFTTSFKMFASIINTNVPPHNFNAVGTDTCQAGGPTVDLAEAGVQIAYTTPPAGALVNFPVLVSITSDTDLGGKAQSGGADIIFTDSTGRNLLPFEIENYSVTSGAATLTAWVNVSSLSSSSDTILYMYYGNPAASSQSNGTGTWNSNYGAVYHLADNAANKTVSQSTSNSGLGGTSVANTVTNHVTGEIDGAQSFNGTTDDISMTSNSIFNPGTNPFTATAWVNTSTNTAYYPLIQHLNANDTTGWQLYLNSGGCFESGSGGDLCLWDGASDLGTYAGTTGNTWQHVAWVRSGTTMIFYLNGNEVGSLTADNGDGVQATFPSSTASEFIGTDNNNGSFYSGNIDEFEYSSTNLTPGWIKTEYNNQSSPGTFYTVGPAQETKIYAPTLSTMLRHGEFFNTQGAIQPFVN